MATSHLSLRRHGKWIILGDLGSGGFSIVKTAQDETTGEHVALKFLKPDKITDKKQVIREVEHMMKINHPNVLRLKEVIWDNVFIRADGSKMRTHLIVLELAPGGELFALLNTTGPFSEPLARTYFKQLVEGLDACHRVGIAHRDLKPENILMGADFSLKIADFGLSRAFESDTMLYTGGGTAMYQPPEFGSMGYDGIKVDNWAAGVILFMMLAGFPPYSDKGPRDWWYDKLVTGRLDLFWMAHERQHVFSPAAKDLINNLLNPDPVRRYSLDQVRKHVWWHGETIRPDALVPEMIGRRRAVEAKRAMEPISGLPSGDGKSNTTRPLGGIDSQAGGGTTAGIMLGRVDGGTTTGLNHSSANTTHADPNQPDPMMMSNSSLGTTDTRPAVGVVTSPQALPRVSQPEMWGCVDSRQLDASDAAYDSSPTAGSRRVLPTVSTGSLTSLNSVGEVAFSRGSSAVNPDKDSICHAFDEASFQRLSVEGELTDKTLMATKFSSVASVTGNGTGLVEKAGPVAPTTPACYTTCADLIACHTKFISSFPARELLTRLTDRLRHWGAKYEVDERHFRIRAKVQCTGGVLSFVVQVWKAPDLLKASPSIATAMAAWKKYYSHGSTDSSSSSPAAASPTAAAAVTHVPADIHTPPSALIMAPFDASATLPAATLHGPALPEGARSRFMVQFKRRAGPLGGFCQIFKDLRSELSDPNDPCTVKMAAMEAARAKLGTETHSEVVAHKRDLLALPIPAAATPATAQ